VIAAVGGFDGVDLHLIFIPALDAHRAVGVLDDDGRRS